MRLVLHIFKKDVRHLWWGIAGALSLQAWMVWLDARNATVDLPDFSLPLIITWACLISLAVHEDPLVGDRQFWITRPSRWPVLLGSKLLFAVAVVHMPSFLADVVILAARGFHPWAWLGSLLAKQFMLAVCLTLPVIALTAVLQSFAYLALAIIAIGGLTAFVTAFTPLLHSQWRGVEDTRVAIFFAVFAVAAAAIVPLQFAWRRTWQSRAVGVAAVLAAELLYVSLSPSFVARVRAALAPAHTAIAIHLRPGPANLHGMSESWVPPEWWLPPEWIELRLPLSVSGIPAGAGNHYNIQALELSAPGNRHYPLYPSYIGPDWLILRIEHSVYESLRNVSVNLRGPVIMLLDRAGPTASIPVGANQPVAGAGRCSSAIVNGPPIYGPKGVPLRRNRLRTVRISCESPAGFPLEPTARLWQPEEPDAPGAPLQGLSNPWPVSLSPIQRVYGSFRVAQDPSALVSARLEITPDIPLGWQVVNLDLRDFRLSDYF